MTECDDDDDDDDDDLKNKFCSSLSWIFLVFVVTKQAGLSRSRIHRRAFGNSKENRRHLPFWL